MRILIGGGSGLIGTALVRHLHARGHQAVALVRRQAAQESEVIPWNPGEGFLEAASLEGFDAIVHLGGESIQAPRWTAAKKRRIRDSRVDSSRLLAERLASLATPPPVMLCASAIGYYGHRGAEELDEASPPGEGFMADTCRAWEDATQPARDTGIRVINLRIGLVLSREGGVFPLLRRIFLTGLGGPLAGGGMYMSWITLDDLVAAIQYCLEEPGLQGPVNAVAPDPVTNRQFSAALGHALHRPAILPVPRWAIQAALGEMGRELLLASIRVRPKALADAGFPFSHPRLADALHDLTT